MIDVEIPTDAYSQTVTTMLGRCAEVESDLVKVLVDNKPICGWDHRDPHGQPYAWCVVHERGHPGEDMVPAVKSKTNAMARVTDLLWGSILQKIWERAPHNIHIVAATNTQILFRQLGDIWVLRNVKNGSGPSLRLGCPHHHDMNDPLVTIWIRPVKVLLSVAGDIADRLMNVDIDATMYYSVSINPVCTVINKEVIPIS